MKISSNINAMMIVGKMNTANSKASVAMQRLSSGLKINSSCDDPAGCAIANKLDTQAIGLNQANQNAMDGISLVQTTEGALNEVHSMLNRIRELAVQGTNDSNTAKDRESAQSEIEELLKEINDISERTDFNGINLLKGRGNVAIQTGANAHEAMILAGKDINIGGVIHKICDLTVMKNKDGKMGEINDILNIKQPETTDVLDKVSDLLGEYYSNDEHASSNTTANNIKAKIEQCVSDNNTLAEEIRTLQAAWTGTDAEVAALEGKLKEIEQNRINTINYINSNANGSEEVFKEIKKVTSEYVEAGQKIEDAIDDIKSLMNGVEVAEDITTEEIKKVITDTSLTVEEKYEKTLECIKNEAFEKNKPLSQIKQILNYSGDGIATGFSEEQQKQLIGEILKNEPNEHDVALNIINRVDEAIEMVSKIRGVLGAYQNRLEHTVANLGVSEENVIGSLSRIQDADMAEEMTNYTSQNVISQAGMSMLAQANQRPQQVLQLLG